MKTYIIAALTADGRIGRGDHHESIAWTSAEDKHFYRDTTKRSGVMVMGSRTFETINHGLPGRKLVVMTSHPEKYAGTDGVEAVSGSPAEVLNKLSAEGYQEAAICGGAAIYHAFLAAGLVDELYLTIEPLLFGSGIGLFSDTLDIKLELLEARNLNDDTLLLHYRVAG